MMATRKFAVLGCAAFIFFAGTVLFSQQHTFDGNWQMDPAKSHLNDTRVVTMAIATVSDGINIHIKIKKNEGAEASSEFTSKLNGKACDFLEGTHKSQINMWYDGTSLNVSKEAGPAEDVTAMWKFELAPDKRTLTLKINHYDPAAEDESIVFTKK